MTFEEGFTPLGRVIVNSSCPGLLGLHHQVFRSVRRVIRSPSFTH